MTNKKTKLAKNMRKTDTVPYLILSTNRRNITSHNVDQTVNSINMQIHCK